MKEKIDVTKFRKPTEKEIEQIVKNFRYKRKSTLKTCRITSCICFVLAIFMFFGVALEVTNLIIGIAFGCVFLMISLSSLYTKQRLDSEISIWKNSDFVVTEGFVTNVVNSADLPGWVNVLISDKYSTKYGWHTVREEGVSRGTKILLAHPILQGKNRVNTYAFSDFMLTDDGAKFF